MATFVEPKVSVLRRSEVARRLGVHPNTVMSWAQRGLLRTVEFPNEVRYREDDVEAFRRKIFGEDE
jgi:excisionase family DNA binding protein